MSAVMNQSCHECHEAATPLPSPDVVPQTPAREPAASVPDTPPVATPRWHRLRRWLVWGGIAVAVVIGIRFLVPFVETSLNTESTDDAYVNGHVTLVAPRISGQVDRVLAEDNMRVKKGDLLVQLDKEPFEVQVALKRAAVQVAEANVAAAESKARSLQALAGAQRWKIQTASQQVKNQVALLKARVAALRTKEANLTRAQNDFERGRSLVQSRAISPEDFDQRQQAIRVAEAAVRQANEEVFQVRASLGLVPEPAKGTDLTEVPADLDETFSDVRSAFSELVQTMTELGVPLVSTNATPTKAIAEFQRRDKEGDLDQIFRDLIPKVPAVMQARAQLEQARHDLDQAELNLRYCDIVSEIDGVVTSRNVNAGNNVQSGQTLLAVRSVTEIWIDANFKETQLAELRIGQRVKVEVDMYGSRREFAGRVTGFTMGTGQTLALLPPQNATGNFVKIVQRLPVRIELTDYDPAEAPLFVGLSVTPYVYFKEPTTGPHAGEVLQPPATLPEGARKSDGGTGKSGEGNRKSEVEGQKPNVRIEKTLRA
jgi:membrane fusion protein (multidrug efflux system)